MTGMLVSNNSISPKELGLSSYKRESLDTSIPLSSIHVETLPPPQSHGEVTPCQIKNHVQRKFATPILYAIDIFKIYDFFLYIHNH
jgi:hypothetical protein